MPELPEVETIRRSLEQHLLGSRITAVTTTVDKLRTPLDATALNACCRGRTMRYFGRRAKFLLVGFDTDPGMILHLGMTGAFRIVSAVEPLHPHDRICWELSDGRSWRFLDSRRFGSLHLSTIPTDGTDPEALRHLGPEPLSEAFTPAYLAAAARGRKRPIKNLIMDQRVLVGVGNIYASEALFRAGIRPTRPSSRLGRAGAMRLTRAIKEVLADAIAQGGTTISDFKDVDGSEGHFRVMLDVYGRQDQTCHRCGLQGGIRRIVQAGRSTFFCRGCQQ